MTIKKPRHCGFSGVGCQFFLMPDARKVTFSTDLNLPVQDVYADITDA